MNDFKTILLEFLKYKKEQFICFLLSIISIVLSLIFPYILKILIDEGIIGQNKIMLTKLTVLCLMIMVVQNGFSYFTSIYRVRIKKQYVIDTRGYLYQKLKCLNGEDFNNYTTGVLSNVIIEDIERVAGAFTTIIFDFIKNVIMSLGAGIILFTLNAKLLIIILSLQLVLILINNYLSKQSQKKTLEFIHSKDNRQQTFFEYLNDLENIISSGECEYHALRINDAEEILQSKFLSVMKLNFLNILNSNILNTLSQLSIWFYGGLMILKSIFTMGDLLAFSTYSGYLLKPILSLSELNYEIRTTIVAINRLNKLRDHTVKNSENKVISDIEEITYQNISFYYNNDNIVLKDITLDFKAGNSYAIIGESGSGKSTLVKLLSKFWEAQSGEIKINGVNIDSIDNDILRERIAIVPQEIRIPSVTIQSYLSLERKVDFKDILYSLDIVGLKDKIINSPKGLESIVNKDISFSVGEKQRMGIAKALLKNGDILIFDEFTSNLDEDIEDKIVKKVLQNSQQKIIIIITHRLQILKYTDIVYELNNGKFKHAESVTIN